MIEPDLNTELRAIVITKLGKNPNPDEVIDLLVTRGAISRKRMRWFVIGMEFFRLLKETDRTARDIEHELGARYDLEPDTVKKIRTAFKR